LAYGVCPLAIGRSLRLALLFYLLSALPICCPACRYAAPEAFAGIDLWHIRRMCPDGTSDLPGL
jgi:hypothetical protein